jgi:hypothetical protein
MSRFSYEFERSFAGSFIAEVVVPLFGVAFAIVFGGAAAIVILDVATSPRSCAAKGVKMSIETEWGFWTGCMINVKGQWLPWSEVIPVERNGRIEFAPKPHVTIKTGD